MDVLLCGGAGYIGSHMAKWLVQQNHTVTVLDNLTTGHREAVKWGTLIQADLLDKEAIDDVLLAHEFDVVMHFCASSLVGESMERPYDYYKNNVVGTLNLLLSMRKHGVDKLIFSSTAAVYGHPKTWMIEESHPAAPINPYGRSKWMIEQMLGDAARAYGLRSVSLRYFNAAGASLDADIGEAHEPETHLIPNVLRAVLEKGRGMKLYGDDYPTPDGTCIRDYVHVMDLAQAHELAMMYAARHEGAHVFNLGSGKGYSVREIIEAAERVTGRPIPYQVVARRPGDPAVLVASSTKARELLGWHPRHEDLEGIIRSAWRWHSSHRSRRCAGIDEQIQAPIE